MAGRPWGSGIRPWCGPPLGASRPHHAPWDNHDLILGVLFGIDQEIVVLAGSFQDELAFMRTRHLWPSTVRKVAAVAAGLGDFSAELGQIADGVLGPSQWEPGVTFPNIAALCFVASRPPRKPSAECIPSKPIRSQNFRPQCNNGDHG